MPMSKGDAAPSSVEATGVREDPRPPPLARAAYLLGPFVAIAAMGLAVHAIRGAEVAGEALQATVACATLLGTSVILGPAVLDGSAIAHLSTWDLVAIVIAVNAATSFLYAFNLDLLERVPWIGPRLVRERHAATASLALRPWIRRRATLGVFLFVLSPLPGSGTLGGTIVGRLVGLSRWHSFVATLLASAVAAGIYGVFGDRLHAWANEHEISMPVRIAGLVGLFVVIWALYRWISRAYRATPPIEPPRG